MADRFVRPPHSWVRKFGCAFRGLIVGVRGQRSFTVHFSVAGAVVGMALWLRLDAIRWAILVLAMIAVLTAEYLNSAVETLAKAVDRDENPLLRDALDVASGGVLCAVMGSVVVGLLVLGPPLWTALASAAGD